MAAKIVHNVFDKQMAYCRTISEDPLVQAYIGVDRKGVHFEICQGETVKEKAYYTDPDKLEARMRDAFPDGKLKGWGRVNYYSFD